MQAGEYTSKHCTVCNYTVHNCTLFIPFIQVSSRNLSQVHRPRYTTIPSGEGHTTQFCDQSALVRWLFHIALVRWLLHIALVRWLHYAV